MADPTSEERLRLPRNVANVNLYDLLGVSRDATAAEIRRARNREALRHHTDRSSINTEGDTDRMASINLAYDVLSTAEGRAAYDDLMMQGDDEQILGIEDGSSASNSATRTIAIGALPSSQMQLSDRGLKMLETWREKWADVARNRLKDSYALIFEADWLLLLPKLEARIPKSQTSNSDNPNLLSEALKDLRPTMRLLDSYSRQQLGTTYPKSLHTMIDQLQCVDCQHALLENLCVNEAELDELGKALGVAKITVEQLLSSGFFPIDRCLQMKRSISLNSKHSTEPEVANSRAVKATKLGSVREHGFTKTKEIKCSQCAKRPGFFARLVNSNVKDEFFACQECSQCVCAACARKCKHCDRLYCAAKCMKACFICKDVICVSLCLSKCAFCGKSICPKGDQCTSICEQCSGLHCKSCTMPCVRCNRKFCENFMVKCSQCPMFACFSCTRNCFICNSQMCCASYFSITGYVQPQPFCKKHEHELREIRHQETKLWFEAALISAKQRNDLSMAIIQLAVAWHSGTGYEVPSEKVVLFIKQQATFQNAIAAIKVLAPNVKRWDGEQLVSWLFEHALNRWALAIEKDQVRPNVAIAALRQTMTLLMDVCKFLKVDLVKDKFQGRANQLIEFLFSRLSSEIACFSMTTALTQALTGGYLDGVIAATKNIADEQQPFLESSIASMEASNFMQTLLPRNKPLYSVVRGILRFKQAKANRTSFSSAFKNLEEAYWNGWIELDDDKLSEILISSIIAASTGEDGINRLELMRNLLHISSEDAKAYNVFYVDPGYLKPPVPNQNWTSIKLRNRDMLPIRKFEMAIRKNVDVRKTWSSLEAALAYTDMLDLCQTLIETIMCFINAALWALQSLKEAVYQQMQPKEVYARSKLLTMLIDAAMSRAFSPLTMLPIKLYTARICGLIANRAGEVTHFKKFCKRLVGLYDAVLFYAPYIPSLLAPIVCVGDAHTLQIGYFKLYSKYLQRVESMGKDAEKLLGPDFKAKLAYFQYELQFLVSDSDADETLKSTRSTAMTNLLLNHGGLTNAHVLYFLNSPLTRRDQGGWLVRQTQLLSVPLQTARFHKIRGVGIDFSKGEIQVLSEEIKSESMKPGYILAEDIVTCFSLGIAQPFPLVYVSLESPNPAMAMHPFRECRIQPEAIRDSLILQSLLQADFLLKELSTGVEISAEPPYEVRSTREGLMKGLAELFVSKSTGILRSLRERGGHQVSHLRMWIQADEIGYNVQRSGEDTLRMLFSDVKMTVRFRPIFFAGGDDDGEQAKNEFVVTGENDPLKAEKSFCADMTKHYEELCQVFPEFRRVQEICKLFACLRGLYGLNVMFKDQAQHFTVSEERMAEISREHSQRMVTAIQEMRQHFNKALADMQARLPYRGDQRTVEAVSRGLSSALSMQRTAEFDRCVKLWLYSRNRTELVSHLVAHKIRNSAPSAPSSYEVSGAVRSMFASRSAKLESAMGSLATVCRSVRERHFGDRKMPERPWVPSICHQKLVSESNRAAGTIVIYGAIILAPTLKHRELPEYNGTGLILTRDTLTRAAISLQPCPATTSQIGTESNVKSKTIKDIVDDVAKQYPYFGTMAMPEL